MGRFHGNMYALKLTDDSNFNSIKNRLVESRFGCEEANEEWMMRLNFGIRRATQSVRRSTNRENIIPEKFLKQLEEYLSNVYTYQRNCVQPVEPLAVICHGDYLRNNIAYRYNESGKAIDAMMFDFQTLRYASPMIDLSLFMAISTGCDVREKYFWNIFSAYHNALIVEFLATTKWNECDLPPYLTYVFQV